MELINKYPTQAFILIIILLFILLGIVFYAVIKGRSIKTPWIRIGSKDPEKDKKPKPVQQQNQTQNVNIYSNTQISEEQISEIAKKIANQIPRFQSEINSDPDLLYNPPVLDSRIIYLHATVNDFTDKLATIVVNEGGGWAGISMAGFGSFLDKAISFNLLPKELVENLNDFTSYTQFYLHAKNISDKTFLDIQYLSTKINTGLNEVIAKMPRKFYEG